MALYEVPISYRGRTYEEGKKIGFGTPSGRCAPCSGTACGATFTCDRGAGMLDALAQTPRFNRWMADTIRPWVGTRVLEIGAGMGNLSRYLAPRRQLYIASDIDDEHLARLRVRFQHRPNVQLMRCDLSAPADFAPLAGQADTVICLNVLEHIEDDAAGLANIASALAPGGVAIVLVPQDPAHLRHARRGTGPLPALQRSRTARQDGSRRPDRGASPALQSHHPSRLVVQRARPQAPQFQPRHALGLRPPGLALAPHRPRVALARRVRDRHRAQTRKRGMTTAWRGPMQITVRWAANPPAYH